MWLLTSPLAVYQWQHRQNSGKRIGEYDCVLKWMRSVAIVVNLAYNISIKREFSVTYSCRNNFTIQNTLTADFAILRVSTFTDTVCWTVGVGISAVSRSTTLGSKCDRTYSVSCTQMYIIDIDSCLYLCPPACHSIFCLFLPSYLVCFCFSKLLIHVTYGWPVSIIVFLHNFISCTWFFSKCVFNVI